MQALLRQLDFHGSELAIVDKELAVEALGDPAVARLMTIPGVDAIAGISIVAAVGDFSRFADPGKLVAYVGLNPKVRQSGNAAPVHGRISKAGRAQVRGILVEAAWSASRAPGPLRVFFTRIKGRRGVQIAVVATAREMTELAWHLVTKDQDYAFARPALVAHKRRKLELAAGAPSRRGNDRTPGAAYNDKQRRHAETAAAEQAERAYKVPVAHWQQRNQPERGQPLDDFIRGVDDPADLGRERQEWGELLPVRPPQLDDGRIPVTPGGGEGLQRRCGGGLVGSGADGAHVFGQGHPVLAGGIPQRGADQVHHAQLHTACGQTTPIASGRPVSVATDDDTSPAAAFELGQHASQNLADSPVLGPTHKPSTCLVPSQSIPIARYTGRFDTTPSRIFTISASMKMTG